MKEDTLKQLVRCCMDSVTMSSLVLLTHLKQLVNSFVIRL